MEILFNKEGDPLLFCGKGVVGASKATNPPAETPKEKFTVHGKEFVSWGPGNNYPDEAVRTIGSTGVLSTGIGFKARTSFGQGVVPMDVVGYDENGEVLRVCQNKEVQKYFRSKPFIDYMSEAFRDIFKFGNCFPILFFNQDGSKIVSLQILNARHCRVSKDKKYLLYFPDFDERQPTDKDSTVYPMLDEHDPFLDLQTRKVLGKLNGQPIAFPRIKNYYSNNDYYGIPDWDAAMRSGWIDIANKIPKFLSKSYANAMSLMWHIKIPQSYWKEKFPVGDYKDKNERTKAIEKWMDDMEKNVCGEENVSKAFISSYETGVNGKGMGWEFDRLENEIDAKERLSTSAAANSEILFSLMINPSVFGAGMPGGAYAGNAGSGSDIRESFLVSVLTTYIEKQQVLFPIQMMLEYNDHGDNLVLKYKETILTTLNTGQAKEEITT
jgi:hypothetical protein